MGAVAQLLRHTGGDARVWVDTVPLVGIRGALTDDTLERVARRMLLRLLVAHGGAWEVQVWVAGVMRASAAGAVEWLDKTRKGSTYDGDSETARGTDDGARGGYTSWRATVERSTRPAVRAGAGAGRLAPAA